MSGTELTYTVSAAYQSILCTAAGNLNNDDFWNLLDIILLANCVLMQTCPDIPYGCAGDMNADGAFNALDLILLANCVLTQTCED
mgnify:FL=1